MNFPNHETVEKLRSTYPVGCRIVLDHMDDPYVHIPVGAQATVTGVDDAGNLMCAWDCGSSLSLAFGADPATGGATFSMTVVNAVAGCYYTVFAATALGDDFVAEKDGESAPADGTLVLTAAAGTPARFFRIVVSTFPVEAGTRFSDLPLIPDP